MPSHKGAQLGTPTSKKHSSSTHVCGCPAQPHPTPTSHHPNTALSCALVARQPREAEVAKSVPHWEETKESKSPPLSPPQLVSSTTINLLMLPHTQATTPHCRSQPESQTRQATSQVFVLFPSLQAAPTNKHTVASPTREQQEPAKSKSVSCRLRRICPAHAAHTPLKPPLFILPSLTQSLLAQPSLNETTSVSEGEPQHCRGNAVQAFALMWPACGLC